MPQPKPITLTQVAAEDYQGAGEPQPFVIVGGEITGIDPQPAIANQPAATLPADFAGVQTQLQSITAKVNAILAALRAAGVIET